MDIHARIREAAMALVAEGVWPTVIEVRARLGTGSNTTINNTLRQWRQDFLARMATSTRRPDWPVTLVEAFDAVWQQACAKAEDALAEARAEAAADVARLVAELASAQREVVQLASAVETAERVAHTQESRLAELDAALQAERNALRVEQERLAVAVVTIEEMREQLKQVRAEADERAVQLAEQFERQLAGEREAAAQRESLAYERFEGLRVRLYQQLDTEREEFKQREVELAGALKQLQARQEAERAQQREAAADAGRERGRLEQLVADWQARHEELSARLQGCEAGERELMAQCRQLQTLLTEQQATWQAIRRHQVPALLDWMVQMRPAFSEMDEAALRRQLRERLGDLVE